MTGLSYREIEHEQAEEEYSVIQNGLNEYAATKNIPPRGYVNYFCYDGNRLIGAAVGNTVMPRLNIKWLWVDKDYRGRKIGAQLVDGIEKLAMKKGCDCVFVDTMDYQAPGFYAKMGYQEAARISEFHPGNDRIFYKKDLIG